MNLKEFSRDREKFQKWWAGQRQKARTDLLFLCNNVLDYRDVEQELHGPIMSNLQKFRGGTDTFDAAGQWKYEPACEFWDLEGRRDTLVLHPRGTLKTTVITIAHAIQWIINYPDIRILIDCATGDQVHKIVVETKGHFQFGEKFRWYFPEFCPPAKKAADFGNMDGFTVPNRKRRAMKEGTIDTCTVGKKNAGSHYEVICHSDLVDENNVKSPGQIEEVKSHFKYCDPFLERNPKPPGHGWTIVEGTIYDFADLHNELKEQEEERVKSGKPPEWNMYVRSAIKDDGTALWPKRLPLEELKRIERRLGVYITSCQYYLCPVPPSSGLGKREQIKFKPRSILDTLRLHKHVTIDLHGMEDNQGNDYTVLTLAGFDNDGRMYVLDIRRGRFTPFETIENIFELHSFHRDIIEFKIEKDACARVLTPFLTREMSKRQKFPVIVPIRRDNRVSKAQRIKGLQPWFQSAIISFADDIECKADLVKEIMRFPSRGTHDDILDTLADQMQNREGGVVSDVYPDQIGGVVIPFKRPEDRFLGFDPITHAETWAHDQPEPNDRLYHHGTGL